MVFQPSPFFYCVRFLSLRTFVIFLRATEEQERNFLAGEIPRVFERYAPSPLCLGDGDGPDLFGPGPLQHGCAFPERRSRRIDIVHKEDDLALDSLFFGCLISVLDVSRPLIQFQGRLRRDVPDLFQDVCFKREFREPAELFGKDFALIESPLPLPPPMERYRNDYVCAPPDFLFFF